VAVGVNDVGIGAILFTPLATGYDRQQQDVKGATGETHFVVARTLGPQLALMDFDDLGHDGRADAHAPKLGLALLAAPGITRREERLEQEGHLVTPRLLATASVGVQFRQSVMLGKQKVT